LKRYFRLVVLSNVDGASFAGSSRRLEVRFDDVVTAEEIGSYKPALGNFRRLVTRVAKLGFERHQILHAAQSTARDLTPAASCGLATAWIERGPEAARDDAIVEGEPSGAAVRYAFRFASLVDMVRAHQEELRA
jgi:2-haloacid dehalogenase